VVGGDGRDGGLTVATIDHIGLAVRDPERSLRFYRDVLGVGGEVRQHEYGYVITTPGGVAFTLFRGEPPPAMGELHVGLSLPDTAAVRAERRRLLDLGLTEVEWCDEPGYTSVKVADPDGYIVEVAWDEASA
jgi:catechol 2,3-dioxygenase-like lactoylglutathione lyase family enzyme